MNSEIETIFTGFTVNGISIPVRFLRYLGGDDCYVTYMQTDMISSLSADDEIRAYVEYYDFDIYGKGNITAIISEIKKKMKANGFTFEPSRCSPDMFEDDTGYYHKTLCFAKEREEI